MASRAGDIALDAEVYSPPTETQSHPSTPVEMHELPSIASLADPQAAAPTSSEAAPEPPSTEAPAAPSAPEPTASSQPPLNRSEMAEAALGPDDAPPPTTTTTEPNTLQISLMLTTGARHPYNINEKYLKSRKVDATNGVTGVFDPREMSGYKLKKLIWTDWRPEWEPKPRDPSSIRLILLGRLIDDKVALKDLPFAMASVNVVHMTVKPADFMDDAEEGTGKQTGRGSIRGHGIGGERGAGCRCVIL